MLHMPGPGEVRNLHDTPMHGYKDKFYYTAQLSLYHVLTTR